MSEENQRQRQRQREKEEEEEEREEGDKEKKKREAGKNVYASRKMKERRRRNGGVDGRQTSDESWSARVMERRHFQLNAENCC